MGKITVQETAAAIVAMCRKHGIIVLRYDSVSSDSVYLRLDEGVLGTIRISDHKGRKRAKHRYNLLVNGRTYTKNHKDGFTEYFTSLENVDQLFRRVLKERDYLKKTYLPFRYRHYMRVNKTDSVKSTRFWKRARYVQKAFKL